MADAEGERLEKREGLGDDDGKELATSQRTGGNEMEWPPGPDDEAGWKRYLEQYPDRAPAVPQSEVRRSAHGLATRLDGDRLRACGNGVVPQQAMMALWDLASRLDE